MRLSHFIISLWCQSLYSNLHGMNCIFILLKYNLVQFAFSFEHKVQTNSLLPEEKNVSMVYYGEDGHNDERKQSAKTQQSHI